MKIKNPFKKKVVEEETTLPDLSIWEKDEKGEPTTPIYIETQYISEQPNEFRMDYRKVLMCIITLNSGRQVSACRNMYNSFVSKWGLTDSIPNSKTVDHSSHKMLVTTVCGYIESRLMQLETQYNIQKVARELK